MPKGPPVHEIFNPPMPGRNASFEFDKKESKQQITYPTKTTMAPLPPMKKFGGYKPKILAGGGNELIPVSTDNHITQQAPSEPPRRPHPVLAKPKPFIIGDKDIPMVLSTAQEDSDDDRHNIHSKMEDMHIYEEPGFHQNGHHHEKPFFHQNGDHHEEPFFQQNGDPNEVNKNDMNNNNNLYSKLIVPDEMLNKNNDMNFKHTHQSPSDYGAFTAPNDLDTLIDTSHTQTDPTSFATDNPVFQNGEIDENHMQPEIENSESRVEPETEPDGVFIPLPDYDEEERTMEFVEEDPDELLEDQQQQQQHHLQLLRRRKQQQRQNPDVRLKVYEGEDFSKYLSDDDDDEMFTNNVNTKPVNVRLQQKHSLFKVKPNTTNNRKASSKNKSPASNSVRSFSVADSKYATNGKSGGKKMAFSEFSGDHDSFMNTSQQGEGYETFLRSKHGVSVDAPNGGDTGLPQLNGKQRDGNILKKLTVRLRHKMHGGSRFNIS